MKRLKIDMSDLMMAFQSQDDSTQHWFLDTETGEVLLQTDDISPSLDEFLEEAEDPEHEDREAFLTRLEAAAIQDWVKDQLRLAYDVEYGAGDRLVAVESDDSHEAYQDMVRFAQTVEDKQLQQLLAVALNGRGAFRRFKDVLSEFSEERQRWFAFRDERVGERLRDWLHSRDIEPVDRRPTEPG